MRTRRPGEQTSSTSPRWSQDGGEQGLLAFAVAPDYATSGRVFAFYTNNGNDLQLDEYRRTADGPDRADLSTRRPILTIQHDQAENHNGGQLLFGPDGRLYLSTGDGGTQDDPEGDAQSLGSLLGKILRLDVGGPPPAGASTRSRRGCARRPSAASACCACAARSSTCAAARAARSWRAAGCGSASASTGCSGTARSPRPTARTRLKVPLGAHGARLIRRALADAHRKVSRAS